MKEKRQTTSNTNKTAGSPPGNTAAETKKGGGVVGGLALFIALGASAVSAYLYTELQKFRNQTNTLVSSSANELKSGVQSDMEGVRGEISNLGGQLNSVSEQLQAVSGNLDKVTGNVDTLGSDLSTVSGELQTVSGNLQSSSEELSGKMLQLGSDMEAKTQAAVTEIASSTASAVQELTSRTESEFSLLSKDVVEKREALQQDFSTKVGSLGESISGVDQTVAKLSEQVRTNYELATKGQRDWILAEVEYLLRTGGHRVMLAGDTKSAVHALRAASDRLHDLGDAAYTPVRAQIAEEVAELRQVGTPDIEGIAFELQKLSKRADTLPLPPSAVTKAVKEAQEDPENIDAGAMADQLFQSLKGLVKVEKYDGTPLIRPGKPTREQLSASEALRLHLQAARLSALRRDQQTYIIHMESAEKYVRENYYQDDDFTIAYLEDLAALKAQNIVPSVSKLGQALTLFNKTYSKRGEK